MAKPSLETRSRVSKKKLGHIMPPLSEHFDSTSYWADAGKLKQLFLIGSEGASAWAHLPWGDMVGQSGGTELLCITETAVKVCEEYLKRGYTFSEDHFHQEEMPFIPSPQKDLFRE